MKVEILVDGIRLIPESTFEQDALKKLDTLYGIRLTWTDDWHKNGPITIRGRDKNERW